MKDKEKQTRRDFFRITFEKTLPLLGANAITSLSMPAFARQNVLSGCEGCNNSCKGKCEGGCAENGCKGGCRGSCSGTCAGTCKEMCAVGCTASSK